jgi:hypothetical protein
MGKRKWKRVSLQDLACEETRRDIFAELKNEKTLAAVKEPQAQEPAPALDNR